MREPSLNVNAGSGNHTIAASITIQGPIAHKWSIAANQTLTINGSINGTQALTKLGDGTLLLHGTNTYGGATTVSLGTLGGSGSIASTVTTAAGTTHPTDSSISKRLAEDAFRSPCPRPTILNPGGLV